MASVWADAWNGIVAGLNYLLQALYGLTGNYGVAIILLTVLIKVVLLPLTIKQTKSMIAMQKIQPEIKKLQEKYKDDKEKLSQEMMKFYKENKVNPLSGCLPLVLQLPVFFALYTVLRKYLLTPPTIIVGRTLAILPGFTGEVATKSASFLWIDNLADTTRIADPTYIFIILLAVSTWYSQKQVMTDPRQKNMMIIMPIVTAFIGLSLPAGVVLYWLVTNILQILQQWGIEYYGKKHPEEEAKGKAEKRAPPDKTPAKGNVLERGWALVAKGRAPAKGTPAKGKPTAKGTPAKGKPTAKAVPSKQKQGTKKGKAKTKQGASAGGDKKKQVRKPKGPPPQKNVKSGGNTRKKKK